MSKELPVSSTFTPREIVSELDRYVIGQGDAKRAVAIALRNRWRRQQVPEDLRDEIAPKNIVMIGPTGVGKTEIARRLARLAQAPFVKVEASKFTEVGYVGRDVDSIVRDLVETSVSLVRKEEEDRIRTKARDLAEDRLLKLLSHSGKRASGESGFQGSAGAAVPSYEVSGVSSSPQDMESLRHRLRMGEFDEEYVELEVQDTSFPMVEVFSAAGLEDINFKDMMQNLPGFKGRKKRRKVKVPEAMEIYIGVEAEKLIDMDGVQQEGRQRAEQTGIVFIDEIDKIVGRSRTDHGPDVSREGVQRDLLPLVEGTTVNTKYGFVKTDHMLFIAAGAFSVSKPADMIPELQGRFPIRVKLSDLTQEDFRRILVEPKNALTVQQKALMKTEGVELKFTEEGIAAMAEKAFEINRSQQNIGARRLYAVMEKVLEEVSYDAPDHSKKKYVIDEAFVNEHLGRAAGDEDLNVFGFAAGTSVFKQD